MDTFCTLEINSEHLSKLPQGLFLANTLGHIVFTDNSSSERLAMRARMAARGFAQATNHPRYWWQLCSDGFVEHKEIHSHLIWILEHLRKGKLLSELGEAGFQYWFSVFWEGNGTGGGPLITLKATELLVRHKAEMGVSFYVNSKGSKRDR